MHGSAASAWPHVHLASGTGLACMPYESMFEGMLPDGSMLQMTIKIVTHRSQHQLDPATYLDRLQLSFSSRLVNC